MGLGVPETMLISAAVGAGTSAATGKDPLLGALLGVGGGALGSAVLGAAAPAATAGATDVAASAAGSGFGDIASMASGLDGATLTNALSGTQPQVGIDTLLKSSFSPDTLPGIESLGATESSVATATTPYQQQLQASIPGATPSTGSQFLQDPMKYLQANKGPLIGAAIGSSMAPAGYDPATMLGPEDDPNNPLRRYRFDPNRYRPGARGYANGGIASLPGYDMVVGETPMYARGGVSDLGTYSDGGRMLKGAGDGMSDSIPGVIAGKRPARLADGEFVVPADVVSHLGNGSTDAGAKQLYKMMDKVRAARTGTKKQGREINPRRFMPA